VAYRAVIIGFPVFATMIVLGSWWASIAWSRYWGWDPKETSALVTWLAYAVYLHLRNQKGWRGRPAAIVLVVGFGMVLFTLFGNLWFSGLHSYSGLS
jgi:ABC-type transport system involved in cytochrome c biogenesis permease subunit